RRPRNDRPCAWDPGAVPSGQRPLLLCGDHELAERLGREEPRNLLDLHWRAEALGRYLRQVGLELRKADVGDESLLLELRLGQRSGRVLDDLAARYLDLECALEAKDHVEEVDRFGTEVVDQRSIWLHLVEIATER